MVGFSIGTRQKRQAGFGSPITISERPQFGQMYFIVFVSTQAQKTFDGGRALWLRIIFPNQEAGKSSPSYPRLNVRRSPCLE